MVDPAVHGLQRFAIGVVETFLTAARLAHPRFVLFPVKFICDQCWFCFVLVDIRSSTTVVSFEDYSFSNETTDDVFFHFLVKVNWRSTLS